MLQHQQAQGAQRKAQNKHESQEIGGEKAVGSFDEADNANHQAGQAGEKSALADAVDAFGGFLVLPGHSFFPPRAPPPRVSRFFSPSACQTFSPTSPPT